MHEFSGIRARTEPDRIFARRRDAAAPRADQRFGNAAVGEAVSLHEDLLARVVDRRDDHAVGMVAGRERILHAAGSGERYARLRRLLCMAGRSGEDEHYTKESHNEHAPSNGRAGRGVDGGACNRRV